jgi:subtilisin family serine protease
MQVDPYERFWQQFHEVERQQPDKRFAVWPPTATQGSGVAPQYVYEANRLLCRTSHVDRVTPGVSARINAKRDLNAHLTLLDLETGADVHQESNNVKWADKTRNAGVETPDLATPHHVMSITPVDMCPADEPVPPGADAQPWPPRNLDSTAGHGVTVLVIDTGVIPDFRTGHPWLSGVIEPQADDFRDPLEPGPVLLPPDDDDIVIPVLPGSVIKEYASHGTFCAGVVGCAAPGAKIRIAKAFDRGGALVESEFGNVLLDALQRHGWPQIISLSAGVATKDGQPLLGLEKFIEALAEHPETLLVAAAGNDAKRDDIDQGDYHFQPASLSYRRDGSVISVGALRETADSRACFSNYGTSVSVYARGENHVNAFLNGTYQYRHDGTGACHNFYPALYPRCTCTTGRPFGSTAEFSGMARWSGTSFATPLVAAMVAAHMSAHPELGSSRHAAVDLIGKNAQLIDDVWIGSEQIRAFL